VPDEPSADFATRITEAYAAEGPVVDVGRGVLDGTTHPDAVVQIPAAMMNRHGLIAGATGTGKTVTLQVLAEHLSSIGVPVFAADMKGDLSGISRPAQPNERLTARADELEFELTPNGSPTCFLSLGGLGPGVPVRAPVSAFGPDLLAKVLGANETQRSSLVLVFRYADEHGLPLLDLADLKAVLHWLTGEGKEELKAIGGVSTATAGVLLRSISELEGQGGDVFFGEPEFAVTDLLRFQGDRGVVSCLELPAVQERPKLFSTFLMWLLASLFETLPEVGDLDKPKLVFFFDEAHLLFEDASDAFLDQVAQTVRLIRSKGVGVFFVTQLPADVPDEVLAQLGNRIQHALRAHTPKDAKALKAAVETYPITEDYDLEKALTELGIGEAIVTILSEKGAPTPVVWTKVLPPVSLLGAVDPAEVTAAGQASPLWPTYAQEIDRQSATELLAAKMGVPAPPAATPHDQPPKVSLPTSSGQKAPRTSAVTGYLRSREGRSMLNTIARGVFGMLKK
jgi:DNA helicase HerA-like ATPase